MYIHVHVHVHVVNVYIYMYMYACMYMSHQAHQEQRTDEEALHGSEMKQQEMLNRQQQLEEQRHVYSIHVHVQCIITHVCNMYRT